MSIKGEPAPNATEGSLGYTMSEADARKKFDSYEASLALPLLFSTNNYDERQTLIKTSFTEWRNELERLRHNLSPETYTELLDRIKDKEVKELEKPL